MKFDKEGKRISVDLGDGRWLMAKAAPGEPQAPAPAPKPHPFPHPFHGGGVKFLPALVNAEFTVTLPNLAGETGCGLTVRGPKTVRSPALEARRGCLFWDANGAWDV